MQLILDDDKTKTLLTEMLVELLQSKREVFYELVIDNLAKVGLANAIAEGEETDFADEAYVQSILDSEA